VVGVAFWLMNCPNDPGPDGRRQDATCHLCQTWQSCGFCPRCCHWFCRTCSRRVVERTMAAVREWVGGPRPGCCGPRTREQEPSV
jgi:hypothetical protein